MNRISISLLLTAALCSAASAERKTTGGAVPADWAPSTGKEMPKAKSPELDQAALEKALVKGLQLARAAKDKPACNAALTLLYPSATRLQLAIGPKTAPVFEALARCARLTKRFQVLEHVARATAGTQIGRASDLATALIGQDRRAEAAAEIKKGLAATPKDPFLLLAMAKLSCVERDFTSCRDHAALALATKSKDPEIKSAHGMAHVSLWFSNLMLGDYAAARTAAAKMPVPALRDGLVKLIVPAERAKLAVDVDASEQLALGTYHLAGKVNPAPFELTFGNGDRKDRELRIEVEIPGVTSKTVKTIVVLGKRAEHVALTPALLPTFAIADVRAPQRVSLDVKVTENDKVVFERSLPTELLPRDYLPTWHKTSADTKRPTLHNAGAWVTPNDPSVEQFLAAAKQRLTGRQSFSGPQSETIPQVQAIFDELKAKGVSYVMDPGVNSDQFIGQRTRLPSEVLASTNAQCLEGTLLFATALEAIGLAPIIVTVPGHAFVGWHASAKDGPANPLFFVETTMVGTGTFPNAVKVAMNRVAQETKAGTFKTGASRLIEVKELRAKGVTAQPAR